MTHTTIASLVASYGYAILFVLILIESFGIPLPGETTLVTAAALAARGDLDIVLVIVIAAAGAILGDNAGYWVGRTGGIALVRRYGRHVGLTERKLDRAHAFFERHGAKTVFIGRFIALLRSWAAALAGVGCMAIPTFLLFNALGGITWALVFGMLGFAFGRNLPLLERYVSQISLALALLAALVAFIAIAVWLFRKYRDQIGEWLRETRKRVATSDRYARLRARHPRFWTFVAARFARGEYLGLHLTVGFIFSVLALWLFGGVTEDVVHNDPLTVVDLQLASWARAHATTIGDRVARIISYVGSPAAMAVLGFIVVVVLIRQKRWIVLAGWIAALAGGGALDWTLKRVIQRARPTGAQGFLYGASFSFPSGHAMGSLIGYGMLVYMFVAFWSWARRRRSWFVSCAFVLVLSIGVSRLYLGVHFLSDVIAGYAAGAVWLTVCVTGVETALRQRRLAPWEVGVNRRRTPRPAESRI